MIVGSTVSIMIISIFEKEWHNYTCWLYITHKIVLTKKDQLKLIYIIIYTKNDIKDRPTTWMKFQIETGPDILYGLSILKD